MRNEGLWTLLEIADRLCNWQISSMVGGFQDLEKRLWHSLGLNHVHHKTMMPLRHAELALCINCVYSGHCVFERSSVTPVLQCAEHRAPRGAVREALSVHHAYSAPTGLCITCDHEKGCSLRSPEKIVLHCEHYE